MEIWKDINGYEGYYQVSSEGRLRSLKRIVLARFNKTRTIKDKVIFPSKGKDYLIINLKKEKTSRTFLLHRIVAIAFIPNPDNKHHVNHIDGDKLNNRVVNLEWNTPSENNKHAFAIGLKNSHGGRHSQNILTEKQVIEIRALKGLLTQEQLADRFKVKRSTISSVHTGKSWKI